MEGGSSDEQVFERNDIADGGLFALDASGQQSDLERNGMHDEIAKRSFSEDATALHRGLSVGAVDTVGNLDNAHGRDRNVYLAVNSLCGAKNIFDSFSAALAGDQNAGV